MKTMIRGFGPRILALGLVVAVPVAALAADKIGVTSAAQNRVEGVVDGQTAPMRVGSPVFQNQNVRTGPSSTAQLLFNDQTSLSVGQSSDVKLDKFIFDPARSSGSVVLSATRGAFRFVSGTQQPNNYQIRTPVATIGVRGTVVDGIVSENSTSIILGEGGADMTLNTCAPENTPASQRPNENCLFHLDVPGQGFTFFDDGRVDGPFTFDGSQSDGAGSTTFPLHTSRFAIEAHDNEDPAVSDLSDRGDEIAVQDSACTGNDCPCPDCGPGF
jgi:FecR protein